MISLVTPCFNEAAGLDDLHERIATAATAWHEAFEVVAVDDGSTDGTWEKLTRLCDTDRRWKALRLSRNMGHQAAISAGLAHARGDAVIVLDADLQDPPEVIESLLSRWRAGFEVVYGVRRKRKEGALKRALYSGFYRLLRWTANVEIPVDAGDFALLDRKVVTCLVAMPERHRFLRGLRAWTGFRQVGVEYERGRRAAGGSKYTLRRLLHLATEGLFAFTVVPLRLTALCGLALSTAAFLGALVYLIRRVTVHSPVPGFATLVILLLFFGGLQLLAIGLVGEYVGRIYEEVKRRPLWIVAESRGYEPMGPRSGPDAPPRDPGALGLSVG